MSVTESLLNRLATRDPLLLRLAERAALAVRLEPGLIRSLRLELVPQADASYEAELWTSSMVQSRSPQQIVLAPRVSELLRERLAQDQPGLAQAYAVIARLHASAPRLVTLEEELLFAGLSRPPQPERLSALLREVIASMRQGAERARGLSSWLMTNFATWPRAVRECEEARALVLVASTQVPRLSTVDAGLPSERGLRLVGDLFPIEERRGVVLRRTRQHLEFQLGATPHMLSVPKLAPRLEIVGHGAVTVTDEPQRVRVGDEPRIEIRSATGESFALVTRADDANVLRRAAVHISVHDSRSGLRSVGSGLLCGPDLVMTVGHLVDERHPHELCVAFSAPFEQRTVRAIGWDDRRDLAILRLSSPLHGRTPLDDCGKAEPGARWLTYDSLPDAGLLLEGVVGAVSEADIELLLHQPRPVATGAPVVVNGKLVGLIRSQSGERADRLTVLMARTLALADLRSANERVPSAEDGVVHELLHAAHAGVPALLEVVAGHRSALTPERLNATAERAIGEGMFEPALALLEVAPESIRREQLRGLALSKLKRHDEALPVLERLVEQGYADAETLSLIAASYKRRWLETDDASFLDSAFQHYRRAHELTGDGYPGINAAALALYMGERDRSLRIAQEIVVALSHDHATANDAWKAATLGEALLLADDLKGARRAYAAAASLASGRWQDVAVMRRQARLNLTYLERDRALLEDAFPIPNVLVFIGHPVDPPHATTPVFPASRLDALRQSLRSLLAVHNVQFGYSSAARGADLIFMDEMKRRGASATTFMTQPASLFRERWVGFGWEGMFDQVVQSTGVEVRDVQGNTEDGYTACQTMAIEQCALKAAQLDQPVLVVLASERAESSVMAKIRGLPNAQLLLLGPDA